MIPGPSRCPFARWRPLPESDRQPHNDRIAGLVLHTAVDAPGPSNIPGYFERADVGAESTYWLTLDGELVQMMYAGQRADATGAGNRFKNGTDGWWYGFDSIETEDEGNPEGVPWTPAQVDRLVELMVWYHVEHDVPARIADGPFGRGFGFHSMWGRRDVWGPVDGRRNPWTSFQGKTCPGNLRVAQLRDEVWPKFLATVTQPDQPKVEVFDMVIVKSPAGAAFMAIGAGALPVSLTGDDIPGWREQGVPVVAAPTQAGYDAMFDAARGEGGGPAAVFTNGSFTGKFEVSS